MLLWRDIFGRFLAALVLACAWLCLPAHAVAESAVDSAAVSAAPTNACAPATARHDYDCPPDFAETATFFPVGTGVSSARVGALVVRTGAGLGADVGLVVLAPPNEVQPRGSLGSNLFF